MSEPQQARIKLDQCVVDYDYQRPVEAKRVARIVDEFNPRQLGVFEVSKRENGTYAIIDGAHRFTALKALGRKVVQATVHHGLSRQDEAKLFAQLNMSRAALKPYQRFNAQVFAGDTDAVAISYAVTRAGFKIASSNQTQTQNPTMIGAIRVLEQSYQLLGEERLGEMLIAIRDCWFGMVGALDASMLGGFTLFWDHYSEYFANDHAERLKRADPLIILQNSRAKALAGGVSLNGGARTALNAIIRESLRKAAGIHGKTGQRQAGRPQLEKKAKVEV